jgi:hypothetical protein
MSDPKIPGVTLTKIGDGAALFAKIAAGLAMAKLKAAEQPKPDAPDEQPK